MTDTEPASWRIYHDEWITAYVAFENDDKSPIERAIDYFAEHYAGRVRGTDVQYVFDNDRYGVPAVLLRLRLPNLRGEFKHRDLAEEFRGRMFGAVADHTVHVVGADTDAEHALRNYGVKVLPQQLFDRISVEPDAAEWCRKPA